MVYTYICILDYIIGLPRHGFVISLTHKVHAESRQRPSFWDENHPDSQRRNPRTCCLLYIRQLHLNIRILNIPIGILDYLRESFPLLVQPFKHTESNSFKHTATTFKYTNWYFILPPGPCRLAGLHIFKCRYRIYTCIIYMHISIAFPWKENILSV